MDQTPLSASGTATAVNSAVTPGPTRSSAELENTKRILATVKNSLNDLNTIYDSLGQQTGQIALLGGDLGSTANEVNKLRYGMEEGDVRHKKAIDGIRALLVDKLQTQAEEKLREQVEKEVEEQIDALVKDRVNEILQTEISKELQEEAAEHNRKLGKLQRDLHNSESRRENALLKGTDQNNALHTIYRSNGEISADFPKTLTAMAALDADVAKKLLEEYEVPNVTESREKNINRFMLFCGAPYQMVPHLP